jgi:hypothetical protein
MGDESEIAELRRRLAVLEQDTEGERTVSRHMLKKLKAIENLLVDLTKAQGRNDAQFADLANKVAELARNISQLETQTLVSQAELPRKLAEIVSVVMSEELAKRK